MKIKAIITGATGMVGKGVLYECLEHPDVEEILTINRNSLNINHPKLKEIIHADFQNINPIKEKLNNYNACFFCMGVSSVGLSEEKFHHLTFDIVKEFADTLYPINPDLNFIYVSGTGTDSSEKGKVMWARVKGKTENYILNKGFRKAFMYRPGLIIPEKGIKSKTPLYNAIYVIFRPLFPLLKKFKGITTTGRLGRAMINTILNGSDKIHLKNEDINQVAGK